MKRIGLLILIGGFSLFLLTSQTTGFFLSPALTLPTGPQMDDIEGVPYTAGFKLDGRGYLSLGGLPLNLHGQIGFQTAPLNGENARSGSFTMLSAQAGPQLSYRATPALSLGLTAQGGGYLGMIDGAMGAQAVLSVRADANLLINSQFLLGLGGDYSYYMASPGSTMEHTWSGMGISLNLSYAPAGQEKKSRLEIEDIIIFPIYPVLYGYYNSHRLGEITIRNGESRDIEQIAVSLYIPKYMAGPQTYSTGESLKKGESLTLPIHGLLDSSILEETEGALVQAEIGISYDLRDDRLSSTAGKEAEVLYRNALTWVDDRRIASFATAREPGVIEFAKNTMSSLKDELNRELDESINTALGIYEALSLYGMKYQIDPSSSYSELSGSGEVLDYLQFPVESLNYKAGDCDDLTVLYTSLLESLAVETAFITVPGHIYPAVALNMSPEEARKTFSRENALIFEQDRAWLPVEATLVGKGPFIDAWAEGSRQWFRAAEEGKAALYPMEDAWKIYPPVALNAFRDKSLVLPDPAGLKGRYQSQELALIDRETRNQVEYLEKAIRDSRGSRRAKLQNSLAVLKARYGLYEEALSLLEPIAGEKDPYLPAVNNLANLHYRMGDLDRASTYYNLALSLDENQPKALLGLMLVARDQGNSRQFQSNYNELNEKAPEIAAAYAHLATDQGGINRASDAASKERVLWDEE